MTREWQQKAPPRKIRLTKARRKRLLCVCHENSVPGRVFRFSLDGGMGPESAEQSLHNDLTEQSEPGWTDYIYYCINMETEIIEQQYSDTIKLFLTTQSSHFLASLP